MDNDRLIEMIESLSLSSNECQRHAQKELDLWLNSSLSLLRDTYSEKRHEIDQSFHNLKGDLEVYKQRQITTIARQKSDLLLQEVERLQRQLPTFIQVKNTAGSIYDLQVHRAANTIDAPTAFSALRYSLKRTLPVQTYRFPSTCRAMACNSKRDEILIYDKDELILYNVNGMLGGSVSWSTVEDGFVSDVIWCSTLDRFLVLSSMTLSLFDTHLYTSTRVNEVRGSQAHYLIALTYVEEDQSVLVCCHDSKETIRQYGILPEWHLKKTWSKNNLINRDDAGIRCIRVSPSGSQLGLVIKNKSDQFRIGLYSKDLTHLHTTISIDPALSPLKANRSLDFMLYISPFMGDRWWLVVYGSGLHEHSLLLVDSETGTSEMIIDDSILNACMLDEEYLIVRMKQSMLIYKIQF